MDVLAKVAEKFVALRTAAWLKKQREGIPISTSEEEIQELMEWIKTEGSPSEGLFAFAMVGRQWRKAQLKIGGPLRTGVRLDAILPGRAALAKWALEEGCPREGMWGDGHNIAHVAAEYGHGELSQWLCEEGGFEMDEEVMLWAAYGGNVELVQWLRVNGCPWHERTCTMAAQGGRLEVLRWAREHGCDWSASTCSGAVRRGDLEVLQWLRANGCPWDKSTCSFAVACYHVDVLEWARDGAPWTAEIRDRAAAELEYEDDLGNLVWE